MFDTLNLTVHIFVLIVAAGLTFRQLFIAMAIVADEDREKSGEKPLFKHRTEGAKYTYFKMLVSLFVVLFCIIRLISWGS